MKPRNLLFIFSDEHNRNCSGAYGHPLVRTPNIDKIASKGVRFVNSYTNCPICIPARAAMATGRYVHEINYWDNGIPYDGCIPSWAHRLRENGYVVDSIGKLHFRKTDDDNGFCNEIDPLHVYEGIGDILGCIKDDVPFRKHRGGVLEAGSGNSSYIEYDLKNTQRSCDWLSEHAKDDKPWALFTGFVLPHPPYIAPEEYFDLYATDEIPLPPQWAKSDWPKHPSIDYIRRFFDYTEQFQKSDIQKLNAAYFGMCTFLDNQIGKLLEELEKNNLVDSTLIIYASDHGEALGARGIFGKFSMYEESVAVPLIMAGPNIPEGKTIHTPVSLIDIYPTILDNFNIAFNSAEIDLPGDSLFSIIGSDEKNRTIFSEYHAVGSAYASFMIRYKRYKFIYHVNEKPQLFDLENDPLELKDLSGNDEYRNILTEYEERLRSIVDPEDADRRAKIDQAAKVEAFGGKQKVLKHGAFEVSPTPGSKPKMVTD